MVSSPPLTVEFAATSLAFRLLVLVGFFSESSLVWAGAAVTVWPSATPLEPLAGLEGFEDDGRLWWERYERECEAAIRGAKVTVEETIGVGGEMKATRRTEDENMLLPAGAEDVP